MDFEDQQKQEETKEQLVEKFNNSLKEYGIEAECRLEKGEIIIEQNVESGICNIGYDKKNSNLWLSLDQNNPQKRSEKQKRSYKTGTMLNLDKKIRGVTMEKTDRETVIIRIDKNHPVAALSRLINKSIYLPGRYNDWEFEEPFETDEETGELKNEIKWDGEPIVNDETVKCKVAIADISCDWDSGTEVAYACRAAISCVYACVELADALKNPYA